MNISQLLAQHALFVHQAHLASLAKALVTLRELTQRAERAGLDGWNALRWSDPDEESSVASLTALDYSQSRLEEHFLDEDVQALADALDYVQGDEVMEMQFQFTTLAQDCIPALEAELSAAGIEIEVDNPTSVKREDT